MAIQIVTSELRQWIAQQAGAGHSADSVLGAMKASGWDEDTALDALETTLGEQLGEAAQGHRARAAAALPPRVAVPGAKLGTGRAVLPAIDRDVRIVVTMESPRVVVFANLLSDDECDVLIAHAKARLTRSETVETTSGSSEVNAARTSDGMFFEPGEGMVVSRLEERIAALLDWPVANGEGLQVLRYRPGTEYKPHYDYFDPAERGTPAILRRGGQRVGSVVCYLKMPEGGGETIFPDVGLSVAPQRGHAVFFSYDRPHPSTRTLHGGAAVTAGEKWVATKWLREGVFK